MASDATGLPSVDLDRMTAVVERDGRALVMCEACVVECDADLGLPATDEDVAATLPCTLLERAVTVAKMDAHHRVAVARDIMGRMTRDELLDVAFESGLSVGENTPTGTVVNAIIRRRVYNDRIGRRVDPDRVDARPYRAKLAYLAKRGISVADMAASIGMKYHTLYGVYNGCTKTMSRKAAEAFDAVVDGSMPFSRGRFDWNNSYKTSRYHREDTMARAERASRLHRDGLSYKDVAFAMGVTARTAKRLCDMIAKAEEEARNGA